MLRTAADDLDMHVVFLKHQRLAAFLQNRAADRFQLHMLIDMKTLPDIQAASNSAVLAQRAWEVTVAQLGAQVATNASFVTILSTQDTPTKLSTKRKREADLAGAEANRLGYNSDGYGSNGFSWPHDFLDAESVNGAPSDDGDSDDDAGDLLSPTPAQQTPVASMAASVPTILLIEPFFPE